MVKNLPTNAADMGLIPGLERSLEKRMATHSNILAGESHGQRSLASYSPWGRKELDVTDQLSAATAAAKSLQSCLTLCDPMD